MSRAVSVSQLLATKFKSIELEGKFADLLGEEVQLSGSWIIWASSANGKTNFALQLAKYLSQFERVGYNTIEEGISMSFRKAVERQNMADCKRRLVILDRESTPEIIERLSKHKSPNILITDSVQYTGMNLNQFRALKAQFPNKLFIWISHADGKEPQGTVAKSIRYDADIKIRVEGFRAFANSRFGGNGLPYVIYEKGSYDYWGN